MQIGIIGLPLSGKTTLFNALCGTSQETGGYTAKGEVHLGVVKVPDERLDILAEIYKPQKVTPAEIEFQDVAGFTGDTSDRDRLDTEIPPAIRETVALAHVVRVFEDSNVPHPSGSVDPVRDIRMIEDELIFSDLVLIARRMEKLDRQLKVNPRDEFKREKAILDKCLDQIDAGKPLRDIELTEAEAKAVRGFQFLSIKPKIIVLNIGESQIAEREKIVAQFSEYAERKDVAAEAVSARVQMELAELDEEDRQEFMQDYGVTDSAIDRLINKSYDLLGLISFLTGGEKQVRAWTITEGTKAPKAAGVIHKDFEKGFIKAEVIPYDKLAEVKSEAEAKKRGWMRLEGKDYVVKDGDVIIFRFNV